jgi:uncharacterized protein YkwD
LGVGRHVVLCCSIAVSTLATPGAAEAALPQLPLAEVPVTRTQQAIQQLVPAPVASMVTSINRARARHRLPPLRASSSLRQSATRYAVFMLKKDYFGHQRRIRASRRYRTLGEALAIHRGWKPAVSATVRQWLRSPGHRALILSHRFRYLGAGQARGRFRGRRSATWVLHFGA